MVSEKWENRLGEIFAGATLIKDTGLNRNDETFAPWHALARDAVARYAPKKLPSFDEIRFASDYFLSKSRQEQENIDDRIALVSDIDLFLQMAAKITNDLEKTQRMNKRVAPAAQPHSGMLEEAREIVQSLSVSPRDRDDVLREIERAGRELAKPDPDWDSIRRAVKFFLDFDRKLALAVVPRILALFPKK